MSAYLAGVKQAYIDINLDERGYDDLMAGNKDSDIYRSIYGQTALGNYLAGGFGGGVAGLVGGALVHDAAGGRGIAGFAPAIGAGLGTVAGLGLGHMQRRRDADTAFSGLRTHLPFALAQALPYLGPQDEPAPEEKRAYGLKDVLGDALAAGTAGYAQHTQNRRDATSSAMWDRRHEERQQADASYKALQSSMDARDKVRLLNDQIGRERDWAATLQNSAEHVSPGNPQALGPIYGDLTQSSANKINDMTARLPALERAHSDAAAAHAAANRSYRDAQQATEVAEKSYVDAAGVARKTPYLAAIGGAVPVGSHYLTTPLLSTLGRIGGSALAQRLGAGDGGRIAGAALGSLAGRTALRGFDTLRERAAKKKAKPADAEPKQE